MERVEKLDKGHPVLENCYYCCFYIHDIIKVLYINIGMKRGIFERKKISQPTTARVTSTTSKLSYLNSFSLTHLKLCAFM